MDESVLSRITQKNPSICRVTCPLLPYHPKGEEVPPPSRRLFRKDSLDLKKMISQLKPSILFTQTKTFSEKQSNWSVLHVFSPYSPTFHVMIMETSNNRVIPGPESCSFLDGKEAVQLAAKTLQFMRTRQPHDVNFVGYNWSPRSWGEHDQVGYQSLATKWHLHVWSWPMRGSFYEKIEESQLSPNHLLLFYSDCLVQGITKEIQTALEKHPKLSFNWEVGVNCLHTTLPVSLFSFLEEDMFEKFLFPLASLLEQFFDTMTEAVSDISSKQIDALLQSCEKDPPSDEVLQQLYSQPKQKPFEEVSKKFQENGWSQTLLSDLHEAVAHRCLETPQTHFWWKKCFAYSVLFVDVPEERDQTLIKIFIGARNGAAGIIESTNTVLCRPQTKQEGNKEQLENLWLLQEFLK